jgi:hypothetical protein
MLKKILYIALVGGIIGGIYGYYIWNKKVDKMSDRKGDFILTAADLAKQYSDAIHLGKVLQVTGTVANVEAEKDVTNVTLETGDTMTAISCEMEKGSEAPSVKTGDVVTMKGQCDGRISDVVLTRCIVVKN